VSRFQFPGLARSLTVYCVDGLVLLFPSRKIFIRRFSQAGELPSLRGCK
jgi:hypothetical protein